MTCKTKQISRKPSVIALATTDRVATLRNHPDNPCSKRWQLFLADGDVWFKTRRAAEYFFEFGNKYTTKPEYVGVGSRSGGRRVR